MFNLSITSSLSTVSFPSKPKSTFRNSSFNDRQSQFPRTCSVRRHDPAASSSRTHLSSMVMRAKRDEEIREIRDLLVTSHAQKDCSHADSQTGEIEQGIKRVSRKLGKQWKKSIVVRRPPSLKKLREEEAEEAEKAA